jgi:hypothetical protein
MELGGAKHRFVAIGCAESCVGDNPSVPAFLGGDEGEAAAGVSSGLSQVVSAGDAEDATVGGLSLARSIITSTIGARTDGSLLSEKCFGFAVLPFFLGALARLSVGWLRWGVSTATDEMSTLSVGRLVRCFPAIPIIGIPPAACSAFMRAATDPSAMVVFFCAFFLFPPATWYLLPISRKFSFRPKLIDGRERFDLNTERLHKSQSKHG